MYKPPLHHLAVALTSALFFASTPPALATLTYDFDDGTLQGWQTILPADPATASVAFAPTDVPDTNNVNPQAGTHLAGPVPWGGRQIDGSESLYLRSPEFFVDSSGDLTFFMVGGSGNASLPATGTDVVNTPTVSSGGAIFVGLRLVENDTYVLQKRRGGQGNGWVAHAFTAAELAPYVGEVCTLDLVDTFNGGWGWTGLDTVSIPGVTGASAVLSQNTFLTTAVQGDAVGTLSTVGGEAGDTYSYALIAGAGSTDNGKFVIAGDQLELGSFDFSGALDGTQYSIRVESTGAPSGEVLESVITLTVETPYVPRLVGFWDFNVGNAAPGAGGVIDIAADDGGHNGTMTGGVLSTDVPAALAGAGSRSLDLTGGNSHVLIDTFSGDASDNDFNAIKAPAMSVSVWVKGWPGNWLPFVAKNGEENGWQIRRRGGNNTGTFTLRGTSGDDDPNTSIDIGPNTEWSHMVGTYDGTVRKMYHNGVEVLSQTENGDIGATTDLVMFGNRMRNGAVQNNHSNLQLDDIGIWNYALSLAEIQELAAGGTPVDSAFEIALIARPAPNVVSLTWTANSSDTYVLNFSTDGVDWSGDLGDSLTLATDDEAPGDGDLLTFSVDLSDFQLENEEDIFFRVSR